MPDRAPLFNHKMFIALTNITKSCNHSHGIQVNITPCNSDKSRIDSHTEKDNVFSGNRIIILDKYSNISREEKPLMGLPNQGIIGLKSTSDKSIFVSITVPITVVLASVLFLLGCYPHTTLPIKEYMLDSTKRQKTLVIFLPGYGGSMDDFKREGILDIVRVHQAPIDVMTVDADLRFYIDRTLLTRIDEDVMPRIQTGRYNMVWLLGNSMGGLGSLLYSQAHPGLIKGIILLGPFLGDEPIIKEIAGSGGLLQWSPKDTMSDNYQRDVWMYLKRCVQDISGNSPRLFLLAGRDDRFHAAHQLLASAMDSTHVFWADGGHDWDAWRSSFSAFARQVTFD